MTDLKIVVNIVLVIIFYCSTCYSQNGFIHVKVVGMEDLEGKISIGLFNDPEGFPKRGENNIGAQIVIEDTVVEHTFKNLNNGEYALAIYHDENNNDEFDRNFLGMPSEDYVFSNYATGSFGPPSFEDAKIILADSLIISLDLRGE